MKQFLFLLYSDNLREFFLLRKAPEYFVSNADHTTSPFYTPAHRSQKRKSQHCSMRSYLYLNRQERCPRKGTRCCRYNTFVRCDSGNFREKFSAVPQSDMQLPFLRLLRSKSPSRHYNSIPKSSRPNQSVPQDRPKLRSQRSRFCLRSV